MAPLSRGIAAEKMRSLVAGAEVLRAELS
jgi:hypothetical protein